MSEIKQVQMSMPVLTKTGRKSRRGVKKGMEEQQQTSEGGAVTLKQPLVLQQQHKRQTQHAGASTTAINIPVTMINAKPTAAVQTQQPMPALSTTSVVGGKKKDALSIGQATAPAPAPGATVSPSNKKVVLAKKAITVKAQPVKTPTLQIQPKTRNNKTLKKSYSAKRITIHMENPKNVRKTRDAVRRNVANMPLNDITEKLRARGLVRPDACPPEDIQRLMLIDIELFPTPM
mgnify:CR=1 FL=1